MPKKIPEDVVATIVELLLQEVSTKDIAERYKISTTSVLNIRAKFEGRGVIFPTNASPTKHTPEVKRQVIELLLEGKKPEEVAEMTGVVTGTIIAWRTQHKNKHGVDFPKHWFGRENTISFGKQLLQGFKYTDFEIIELARLNPGYGIERFARALYPKAKSVAQHRYRITMLLNDHMSETGEDLYDSLQDESFMEMVSEKEYMEITGAKRTPRGHGRATGGRTSKPLRKQGPGEHMKIPLPPQKFNWGKFADDSEREWKKFEQVDS